MAKLTVTLTLETEGEKRFVSIGRQLREKLGARGVFVAVVPIDDDPCGFVIDGSAMPGDLGARTFIHDLAGAVEGLAGSPPTEIVHDSEIGKSVADN